jgi:hypothetical protein
MDASDRGEFAALVADVMAFYRQDCTEFTLTVWWEACKGFELEQVRKAFTAHAMDPERGQFAPKPADVVRELAGTHTDRALLAWGKVHEAAARIGAYQSVAFDDPAIHAAIEDVGGWMAVCRTEAHELPHLQRRFCDSYRAYRKRGNFEFLPVLHGESALTNAGTKHDQAVEPKLIGNRAQALLVARGEQHLLDTPTERLA